jgi:hypothetical protein
MERINYKRFLSYIYTYQENTERKNVGFAKVEYKGGRCKIYISINQLENENIPLQVALLMESTPRLLPIGRIYIKDKRGEFLYQTHDNNLSFNQMEGIVIYDEKDSSKYMMSLWKDREVHVDELIQSPQEEEKSLTIQEVKIESCSNLWEKLRCQLPLMKIQLVNGEKKSVLRLRLMDIYKLPNEGWSIIENSFLQYGYYRGRHLILFLEGEELYLGVPGCHPCREEESAKANGFVQFLNAMNYGYWYRKMDLG